MMHWPSKDSTNTPSFAKKRVSLQHTLCAPYYPILRIRNAAPTTNMEHNKELATAWDFVEHTGTSIFLTGKGWQQARQHFLKP